MSSFSIADAGEQLSRLIEMVEAGAEITITKEGRPVAKLVSTQVAQALPTLAEFRATLPQQVQPAADFIRELRDTDRN
jgi:prevent-host-death family protein